MTSMRNVGARLCWFVAALTLGAPGASATVSADWQQRLDALLREGDFAAAASWCQVVAEQRREAGDRAGEIDALVELGEALQAQGDYRAAIDRLGRAGELATASGDQAREALATGSLGKAHFLAGASDLAVEYLARSTTLATQLGLTELAAASAGNLATLLTLEGKALAAVAELEPLAASTRLLPSTRVRAVLALTTADLEAGDLPGAARRLLEAKRLIDRLPDSAEQAALLIAVADGYRTLGRAPSPPPGSWLQDGLAAANGAAALAAELDLPRTRSRALGLSAELLLDQDADAEALLRARQASFAAQQAATPDLFFRWQWQIGRILRGQGDMEGARAAYRRAVATLSSIRTDIAGLPSERGLTFRQRYGALYLELADLLLQSHRPEADDVALREARNTVELLKAAELEDYYQDECVRSLQARTTALDEVGPGTLVVYPILLDDRTELLLSSASGLSRVPVPVGRETLAREARQMRVFLERRTTHQYRSHARKLHAWLIEPMEERLQAESIDTLVFVPDGPLLGLPMGALFDGQRYLIQDYAVASTLGIQLVDARPIRREQIVILATGLTLPVQGFPGLRYADTELMAIREMYPSRLMQDREFRIPALQQALEERPYTIVHIASHGQFSEDLQDTFVLTFDGRLTMDRLEEFVGLSRFRREPVELLTLSACETAAGDDRAALGLAGIAVKAGARSALATLWYIDDRASALLVTDFYQNLGDPSLSKARALQQAQLRLLNDARYEHPGYWSPFLLVGNWR